MPIFLRFSCLYLCLLAVTQLHADTLNEQRTQFLRAEQLLAQNNIAEYLPTVATLNDYPLYPYIQHLYLKKNLSQTEDIHQFLGKYPQTRYADLLRAKWLLYLAEQNRWPEIKQFYQPTDAVDLQCLYNQALLQDGQKDIALAAAKTLWSLGEELPAQCNYLMSAFKTSPGFSKKLLWQRFELALQNNAPRLAEQLIPQFTTDDQALAKFWLQAYQNPELVNTPKFSQLPANFQASIFSQVIQKLARKSPSYAALLWENKEKSLAIDVTRHEQVNYALALNLAKTQGLGAFVRLMQVKNPDPEIKEWRLRTALIENNWSHVQAAIQALSPEEQNEPRWQYWHARALAQLGQQDSAKQLFTQAGSKRDYYGYLAADYADLDYKLEDRPVQVAPQVISELLASDDVKLIQELKHMQRDHEAQSQWWYWIKKLDKPKIEAAAKIAQQWHWQHIAIFTIAKAENWDDVDLRFPLYYQDQVLQNATQQNLDPAIVLGLIRQESAFNQDVASPVGARGLMQIMPTTGSQIARELNESLISAEKLYDPNLNIHFGSYYYKKLLDRFKGHFALAAAAYNAGPHRVDSWLPKSRNMPADVWIETIPFKETRRYVSSVLFYAMIYQQRLSRHTLKMRDFIHDVLPL